MGPQNVKILGPQGPKILKLWGPGGPKMGGPILTWHRLPLFTSKYKFLHGFTCLSTHSEHFLEFLSYHSAKCFKSCFTRYIHLRTRDARYLPVEDVFEEPVGERKWYIWGPVASAHGTTCKGGNQFSDQCMVVDRNTAMAAYTACIGKFHPVASFVREYADQLSAVAWLISS